MSKVPPKDDSRNRIVAVTLDEDSIGRSGPDIEHERAIAISMLDHIPTSKQQDIKVELTGKTPPTRRDVEEKRGVLAWETTLQPDEERQIDFGYRVSWPAGKSVMYGQ